MNAANYLLFSYFTQRNIESRLADGRLTDDLERALALDAMMTGEPLHPLRALKSFGKAAINACGKLVAFIDSLNEFMTKAHSRSSRYAGSQW
jgi:hypothetical protein